MGCCGEREKGPVQQTARWDYITLPDFKSTSAWTPVTYAWLWLMAFVSIAVYAADTFTAINLLAFNHWSSQVQPAIDFKYSKWIFAICILISWALCIFSWLRAIRIIRRGGVASSYMDPLAMSLQSMRGQGWRRFLVFTELTKSKKGADYVAFFVYYAFQGAVRVVLAEGPRQVVNALTLYSVMQAKLLNNGEPTDHHSSIEQFFLNIESLADQNYQQAVILFSMLFTLIVWVFSALCLIAAAVLYIVFLWHYIPQRDGRLKIYCRRKIDRRLEKIVEHKIKAAIEDEQRQKEKAEKKAELKRQKTGEVLPPAPPKIARQPTLPDLGPSPESKQDEKFSESQLQRQDTSTTVSTLPRYESRPPTRQGMQRQPTLPDMQADRPGMPSRSGTQGSGWSQASYRSDAPLMANAGYAGEDPRITSPAPTYTSRQDSNASFARPVPDRMATQRSMASQRVQTPMSRNDSWQSRPLPGQCFPVRSNTGFSFEQEPQSAMSPISPGNAYNRQISPVLRQNTQDSFHTRQGSQTSYFGQPAAATPGLELERRPTYGSLHSHQRSFSRPGPIARKPSTQSSFNRPFSPPTAPVHASPNSYEMTSQPSYHSLHSAPTPSATNGYVAFNPNVYSASSTPLPSQQGPRRNITVAGQPGASDSYFGQVQEVPQRSVTAPAAEVRATSGYGDILDDYGPDGDERRVTPPELPRAYTAGPLERDSHGWSTRF